MLPSTRLHKVAGGQATFDQLAANLGCSVEDGTAVVGCMMGKSSLALINATDPYYGNGSACMYHLCPDETSLPNGESLTGVHAGALPLSRRLGFSPLRLRDLSCCLTGQGCRLPRSQARCLRL